MSLTLLKIRPSKNGGRVYLYLGGQFTLPLSPDQYVGLSLTKGQEVDTDTLSQIARLSLSFLSWEYSLRQVALSPKTVSIIRRKLKLFLKRTQTKYGLNRLSIDTGPIIDKTVERLNTHRLLNPQDYANYYISRHPHKSRHFIESHLRLQGVNLSAVDLSSLSPASSDIPKIKKFLSKRFPNLADLSDKNLRDKAIASLYRRGFSLNDIFRVIDDLSRSQ